jgi:hypothetical protein
MSDNPDLDELAERYLDLWQDQLSTLAGDPEFAEVMTRLMASSAGAMPAAMPGAAAWAAWPAAMAGLVPGAAGKQAGDGEGAKQAGGGKGAAKTTGKGGSGPSARPPGAKAAAAAPGDSGADLVELVRRLAALEERVAVLESGLGRGRGHAQGRSRKTRA